MVPGWPYHRTWQQQYTDQLQLCAPWAGVRGSSQSAIERTKAYWDIASRSWVGLDFGLRMHNCCVPVRNWNMVKRSSGCCCMGNNSNGRSSGPTTHHRRLYLCHYCTRLCHGATATHRPQEEMVESAGSWITGLGECIRTTTNMIAVACYENCTLEDTWGIINCQGIMDLTQH